MQSVFLSQKEEGRMKIRDDVFGMTVNHGDPEETV